MRLSQTRSLLLAAVAVGMLGGLRAEAQSKYKVTDLGVGSGTSSSAYGINASGHVVGVLNLAGGVKHAFRWDPTSANGTTGTLDDIHPAGAASSLATGINSSGMVVGWFMLSGMSHPFRTAAMSAANLVTDDLGGGTQFGVAYGINDSGVVVGQVGDKAFRTSGPTISMATDGIGPVIGNSQGTAIANSGVAVGSMPGGAFDHAGKAAAGGAMADIMPGGPLGAVAASFAAGVNSSSVVVGAVTTDNAESFGTLYHAYRTSPGANINPLLDDLGTLGDKNSKSYAFGVNSSGLAVGVSEIVGGGTHGFLAGGDGMVDLNTLLDAASSGWVITAAYGVNDLGQIVGEGIDPVSQQTHAVLLTIPTAGPTPLKLNSLSPNAVLVGSGDFELTVFGTGFDPSAKIVWRKLKLATTFVSSGELRATVPGAEIAKLGNAQVKVENPGPVTSSFIRVKILPYIYSVQVKPNSVFGGFNTNGIVYFYFPSPVGGATVDMSSENPEFAVPAAPTVFLPQAFQSQSFVVNTTPVLVNSSTHIVGTYAGSTRKGTMRVKTPQVLSLVFSPNTVKGGVENSTGTVTLDGPAPAGGLVITLNSLNTSLVTVPATVTVDAGQSTATFTATSHTNAAKKTAVQVQATRDGVKIRVGKLSVTN